MTAAQAGARRQAAGPRKHALYAACQYVWAHELRETRIFINDTQRIPSLRWQICCALRSQDSKTPHSYVADEESSPMSGRYELCFCKDTEISEKGALLKRWSWGLGVGSGKDRL